MKQYLVYNLTPGRKPYCVLVVDNEEEAKTRVEHYAAQAADFGRFGQYTYVELDVPEAMVDTRLVQVDVSATIQVPGNWTEEQTKAYTNSKFRSTNEITIDSLSINNN